MAWLLVAICLFLTACGSQNSVAEGGSATEIPNGIQARVLGLDEQALVNAKVKLIPVASWEEKFNLGAHVYTEVITDEGGYLQLSDSLLATHNIQIQTSTGGFYQLAQKRDATDSRNPIYRLQPLLQKSLEVDCGSACPDSLSLFGFSGAFPVVEGRVQFDLPAGEFLLVHRREGLMQVLGKATFAAEVAEPPLEKILTLEDHNGYGMYGSGSALFVQPFWYTFNDRIVEGSSEIIPHFETDHAGFDEAKNEEDFRYLHASWRLQENAPHYPFVGLGVDWKNPLVFDSTHTLRVQLRGEGSFSFFIKGEEEYRTPILELPQAFARFEFQIENFEDLEPLENREGVKIYGVFFQVDKADSGWIDIGPIEWVFD